MAKFAKTVDIWNATDAELMALQPGQWVTAGPDGTKGRFFGVGASITVAWHGRAPRGQARINYLKAYAAIGKAQRARAA